MNCASCRHIGRCDGNPGDDCYEPVPVDTRPEIMRFDDDLSLVEAYHSMRAHCPEVRVGKTIKLSGKFVTLETVRAMRATI